jgi:hypothetical protein
MCVNGEAGLGGKARLNLGLPPSSNLEISMEMDKFFVCRNLEAGADF